MKVAIVILLLIFVLMTTVGQVIAQTYPIENGHNRQNNSNAAEIKISPKAYYGTITDKTDASLQIRSFRGEIQQIAIEKESVKFIRTDNNSVAVNYEDIGIGDNIIAMGFKNANDILDARRIVAVPHTPLPAKRIVVMGTVKNNDKLKFNMEQNNTQNVFQIDPLRGVKLTSHDNREIKMVSEYKEGSRIIVMGIMANNIITARRIHLLP
jgi:hypothetical protein